MVVTSPMACNQHPKEAASTYVGINQQQQLIAVVEMLNYAVTMAVSSKVLRYILPWHCETALGNFTQMLGLGAENSTAFEKPHKSDTTTRCIK